MEKKPKSQKKKKIGRPPKPPPRKSRNDKGVPRKRKVAKKPGEDRRYISHVAKTIYGRNVIHRYTEEYRRFDQFVQNYYLRHNVSSPSIDQIKFVLDWIAESTIGISLHPYLVNGLDRDYKLSLFMSWFLWIENKCATEPGKKGEWFCVKYDNYRKMISMHSIQIYKYSRKLKDMGIIETEKRGVPSMMHVRIDWDQLITLCIEGNSALPITNEEAERDKE